MRKIIVVLTALLATINLSAGSAKDSLRTVYGHQAVVSNHLLDHKYADTLDTGNPYIKILLYNDNTWRYHKDPDFAARDSVFMEYWSTSTTNPYEVQLADLPDTWTVWVADSLDTYCAPYVGRKSSKFGYRHGRRHQGVDLPYPVGTPVYAAFDGKVRIAHYVNGYGNLVVLRHTNGLETYYGHLKESSVNEGDWVSAGQVIGLGGSTGRSTGPHLHFETRWKGFAFDPEWLIDFETGNLRHRLFRLRKWYFNPSSRFMQEMDDELVIAEGDEQDRIAEEERLKEEARKREAAEKAARKYYKIRQGDTLSEIAKKHGTSVKALCRLNGINEKTILQVGKTIRIR